VSDDPWFAVVAEPELIDPGDEEEIDFDAVAVVCNGLSKWFGDFQALDNLSLTIDRGEVVCIVGRSGSGKSTFLRCINRLERFDKGSLHVLGMSDPDDVFETRILRERVGMVFQDFNLFPMFTVEQNVSTALRLVHGWPADRARDQAHTMLDRVDMRSHASKRPSQLSGGEQQRVAIARTLAMEPQIILLDEPTASIDPELTRGVMDLVAEMAATEVTIVAVTHEIGFAKKVSNRVLFFDYGQLVEEGTPEHMFGQPDHPETRKFMEEARLIMV